MQLTGWGLSITIATSNISIATQGSPNSSTASISVTFAGTNYTIAPAPTGGHFLYSKSISLTFTIKVNGEIVSNSSYYRSWTRETISSTAPFLLEQSIGSSTSASQTASNGESIEVSMTGSIALIVGYYPKENNENTASFTANNYSFSATAVAE